MAIEQPRRRGSSGETRERLVDAATDLFAEKGYEFRLQEVARRAGVTTGAIYSNFPDKMGLFAAVMRRVAEDTIQLVAAQTKARGGDRSPRALLAARLGSRLVEKPPRSGVLLVEALVTARRDDQVRQFMQARLRWWASELSTAVVAAKDAGDLASDVDPAAVVRLLQAVTLGSLLLEVAGGDEPSAASWEAVADRILDGLAADRSGT